MQETESKNESQFYITRKKSITQFIVIKTTVIFFSDFHWHDLGLLGKVLIFLGFLGKTNCQDLGKINCQDLGKKPKKSKILATNEKSKILARNSRLSKIIQDLGNKTKTPSTGWLRLHSQ